LVKRVYGALKVRRRLASLPTLSIIAKTAKPVDEAGY
jgi:hypothetical protein